MGSIKVCVGALVWHGNRVLLVKRKNPPEKDLWALPGGKVRFGEPLKDAVEREVLEETALLVRAIRPIYTFEIFQGDTSHGRGEHFVIIDFLAQYRKGDIRAGDDAGEVLWASLETLSRIPLSKYTRKFFIDKLSIPLK